MIELELSTIPDSEQDIRSLTRLVEEFGAKFGAKVRLRQMTWNVAWTDLLTIASQGKGPDVSHIGGTWVSSLVAMNALRPFKLHEVMAIGEPQAFLAPTWQSGLMYGDDRVWAIPWTGYIYVICYRKDLLASVGIDTNTAFSNPDVLSATLKRLQASSLEIPWLNPYIPPPYTDLLHIASSWVYANGGRLITDDGKKALFAEPPAIRGLTQWLDSYRAVSQTWQQLGAAECVHLFASGRAAAVQTDIRTADSFVAGQVEEEVRQNLGITTLTNTPWCGGGSFVIWQHIQGIAERERLAVELVKFLTSPEHEIRWAREVQSMPARREALDAIYTAQNPLAGAIQQTSQHGHTYPSVPLWRRLEHQVAQALGACLNQALENPAESSEAIVRARMEPLAERINLMFGN